MVGSLGEKALTAEAAAAAAVVTVVRHWTELRAPFCCGERSWIRGVKEAASAKGEGEEGGKELLLLLLLLSVVLLGPLESPPSFGSSNRRRRRREAAQLQDPD